MRLFDISANRAPFLHRLFNIAAGERNRLEDFLSEILGEILNRLSRDDLLDFLEDFFFGGPDKQGVAHLWKRNVQNLVVRTQWSIDVPKAGLKRPDIVIFGDRRPLAIIECKVGAGFTFSELRGDSSVQERSIEQLEAYGTWLLKHGGPDAALILLTQYSDPPSDFFTHRRFGVSTRVVRRWSDLCRFLGSPQGLRFTVENSMLNDLGEFIEENKLMINDVQAADFAAARLYMGLQSHWRLIECINEASKEIRPILKQNKITQASKSYASAFPDGDDTWLIDCGWNEVYEVGWGFWFAGSDIAAWSTRYDPPFTKTEGVVVYVDTYKPSPITRPKSTNLAGWSFPAGKDSGDKFAITIRDFQGFLGDKDSTRRITNWLVTSAREAVKLIKAIG